MECKAIFYFNPEASDKEERLQMATALFTKHGGEVESIEEQISGGTVKVTLTTDLPKEVLMLHRGFDSELNKAYPDGAGAGEVWGLED